MRTIGLGASRLGFALLGLLDQAPASGYDLRKTFSTSPLAHFSDSPGAIYPALVRLQRRGWIEPMPGQRASRRRRVAYRVTRSGRRAFLAWLRTAPSRAEVVHDMDALVLRFAFMSGALPSRTITRYLDSLRAVVEGYVAELDRFLATAGAGMPVSGRLAFESGIEVYRGYGRWAAQAGRRLRAKKPSRRSLT